MVISSLDEQYLPLLADVLTGALAVLAQTRDTVGAWVLAGADKLLPDSTRVPEFGNDDHGLVIFGVTTPNVKNCTLAFMGAVRTRVLPANLPKRRLRALHHS